jgi:hypothetical protein
MQASQFFTIIIGVFLLVAIIGVFSFDPSKTKFEKTRANVFIRYFVGFSAFIIGLIYMFDRFKQIIRRRK